MVNSAPPGDPAPPTATGTAEILQQFIAQNQDLIRLFFTNSGKSGNKNNSKPPNPSAGPRQGQPSHPMPAYFDKYCWTHRRGNHKGGNCNSKDPGHKEKTTMEHNIEGSNYGLME